MQHLIEMKITAFLFLLLLLIGCSNNNGQPDSTNTPSDQTINDTNSAQNNSDSTLVKPEPPNLEVYLNNVEKTALSHDAQGFMQLLDANYVREQHDHFLNGRTEQFLNELFCGNEVDKEGYQCLNFNEINHIQQLKIVKNGQDSFRAYYRVSDKEHTVEVDWYIHIFNAEEGQKIGLIGAVG